MIRCAATRPRHTMIFGRICATCAFSQVIHASCSSGAGSRFCGGRHLTMFAIYTFFSRDNPTAASIRSSSCPAAPTNGSPLASSLAPGPSPINNTSASVTPAPNTTCVRVSQRGHFRHAKHCSRSAFHSVICNAVISPFKDSIPTISQRMKNSNRFIRDFDFPLLQKIDNRGTIGV